MSIEETGPLEATIKNLQQEIENKGRESTEMQRRWIAAQVGVWRLCFPGVVSSSQWGDVYRFAV